MRRWIGGASVVAVLTLVVAWWWMGREGSTALEAWISRYLVAVSQEYLNPRLSMEALDYRYPRTVVVSNLRIDDGPVTLLAVERATIELAEVPRTGEPLRIERVELVRPQIRLISSEAGGLTGWGNLVRQNVIEDPNSPPPGFRLSDFLRMRRVAISNGEFVYDSGSSLPQTVFSGIEFQLDTVPNPDAPGLYQLNGSLARPDLAMITLDAQIDLDTSKLQISSLRMEGRVDASRYSIFPPSLQAFLQAHEIAGSIRLDVSGAIVASEPAGAATDLRFDLALRDAQWGHESGTVSCQRLDSHGSLTGRLLHIEADADVLDGVVDADFDVNLEADFNSELRARVERIQLASLIELLPDNVRTAAESYCIAGALSGNVNASITSWDFSRVTGATDLRIDSLSAVINGAELRFGPLEIGGDFNPKGFSSRVRGPWESGTADVSTGWERGPDNRLNLHVTLDSVPAVALTIWLPKRFQQELSTFPVEGKISVEARASIPLKDWRHGEGTARLSAQQLRFACRDRPIGVTDLIVEADLAKDQADLRFDGLALGGRLQGSLSAPLGALKPLSLGVTGRELGVRELSLLLPSRTLQEHYLTVTSGRLSFGFTGTLDLRSVAESDMRLDLQCTDAIARTGNVELVVPRFYGQASLMNRNIATQWHLDLQDGNVHLTTSLSLDPPKPFDVSWKLDGLKLESLVHDRLSREREPRYRGRLKGFGRFQAAFEHWPASLDGVGELQIDHGRLVHIPIFSDLLILTAGGIPFVKVADTDKANAHFSVFSDRVTLRDFDATCLILGIRGRGDVYYDGHLDLMLQASPLTRLESLLGPLRPFVQSMGDQLLKYRVRGTVAEPQFEVEALGASMPHGTK